MTVVAVEGDVGGVIVDFVVRRGLVGAIPTGQVSGHFKFGYLVKTRMSELALHPELRMSHKIGAID